jgi:DNA adenine methylase
MNSNDLEPSLPLIKWAGGKRRLIHHIREFIPTQFSRYFEPFFGGGALFFSLAPPTATLNDANGELIQMYVQVRDNPDNLLRCLRRMPNSEKDYYRIRSLKPRTGVAKAARLIYLCTLSFNGIYRQNLNGEFNVPYGHKVHLNPCDELVMERTSKALQGKLLVAGDFEQAVSNARKDDFIYFDPPYTVAHGNNGFVKYNAKIFSWADQKRLACAATRLKRSGCNVIVSNADHSSIRALYPDFKIRVIERHSVMAASREFRVPVRECLFYWWSAIC